MTTSHMPARAGRATPESGEALSRDESAQGFWGQSGTESPDSEDFGEAAQRVQERCLSSSAAATVIESGDLATLPSLIDAAVADVQAHAGGMVQAAVRAGQLLLEAKAAVQHGEWETWLTNNCVIAARTAQAYMRLATKLSALPPPEAQSIADLPLGQALRAIATPAVAPPAYRRNFTDMNKARPTFEAAARSLGSVARDVGCRKLTSDRIKNLRERLQAVQAELDRMLDEAQS